MESRLGGANHPRKAGQTGLNDVGKPRASRDILDGNILIATNVRSLLVCLRTARRHIACTVPVRPKARGSS
jgi:hypothetical protein